MCCSLWTVLVPFASTISYSPATHAASHTNIARSRAHATATSHSPLVFCPTKALRNATQRKATPSRSSRPPCAALKSSLHVTLPCFPPVSPLFRRMAISRGVRGNRNLRDRYQETHPCPLRLGGGKSRTPRFGGDCCRTSSFWDSGASVESETGSIYGGLGEAGRYACGRSGQGSWVGEFGRARGLDERVPQTRIKRCTSGQHGGRDGFTFDTLRLIAAVGDSSVRKNLQP
jgi:hypothetical protein